MSIQETAQTILREALSNYPYLSQSRHYLSFTVELVEQSSEIRRALLSEMEQHSDLIDKNSTTFMPWICTWNKLCGSVGEDPSAPAHAYLNYCKEGCLRKLHPRTENYLFENFLALPENVFSLCGRLLASFEGTLESAEQRETLANAYERAKVYEGRFFFPTIIDSPEQSAENLLENLHQQIEYLGADWNYYWNIWSRRFQIFLEQPSDTRLALIAKIADGARQEPGMTHPTVTFYSRLLDMLLLTSDDLPSPIGGKLVKTFGTWQTLDVHNALFQIMLELIQEKYSPGHIPGNLMGLLRRTYLDCKQYSDTKEAVVIIQSVLEEQPEPIVNPGESWADKLIEDLDTCEQNRETWNELIRHCSKATSARPRSAWTKEANECLEKVDRAKFAKAAQSWFALVGKPRTFPLRHWGGYRPELNLTYDPYNSNILRGLIWMASLVKPSSELARAMGHLVETSLKKAPSKGPRSPKIATAAVTALAHMNTPAALAQLARLKTRVRFKTTLKEIDKALDAAAQALGVSKADLEEISVPSFDLDAKGSRKETFGDVTATLEVAGSHVNLNWFNAEGKRLKHPPSSVKKDFAADLKALKSEQKDIAKTLTALSTRLDNLFLVRRSWPLATWRERYVHHPLVGTLARRLIWKIDDSTVAINPEGGLEGPRGEPCTFADDATVSLWHPIEANVKEIMNWRDWLERRAVTQPFKQAHREVYLLTDAEHRTGVYSNRFAAHILKQHQFNALCALRGWKNSLRLMVDDSYPPATLALPQYNLRAEFWVEGAGNTYGVDTNETGTYLYISTDQVRFYTLDAAENSAHAGGGRYGPGGRAPAAEPVLLESIPPLVFSEVMRDVDMFVGVCSVANDPTWQDGGPEGRYRDYWQSYSFGELSATAATRKALLAKLLPRLKIAERCRLEGRFLNVQGDLRRYKIHLGSGNILMAPDDQYLCIVPNQTVKAPKDQVFLPFEGDQTLSLILSKAFLLADDSKIKDSLIMRQIGMR